MSANERAHFVSQYDGEIAYMDAQLGELLQRLRRSDLFEDTLIIVTSDHGEAFGERELVEHGVSVYQDQVHVPLIVKFPGQAERIVVDELVSHVDLMPTILALADTSAPNRLDGLDLRGFGDRRSRAVISESFRNLYFGWTSRLDREERAVFRGPLKLIHSTTGKRELYNLLEDPMESEDLHAEMQEDSRQLLSLLETWQAQVADDSADEDKIPRELDEETRDALRSLGYIQ